MSLRNQLLAAIAQAGGATINDLEESTGLTRKKLHDNIKAALTDDLLTRSRDVVTGLPYYQLTAKGQQRLAAAPNAKLFHERQPQPAVGDNTGSRESVPPVGQVSPPAEVAASEGNAGAGHDASADSELSGELRFALGMIRKALGIDHDPSIGIVPTIEALIESNNDWRASTDSAQTIIENQRLRIAALEDEIAYLTADSGKESAFTADDTIAPRYLVVHPDELYHSPQEAADATALLSGGIVIEARAIGTVQVKAVFVPHPEAGQ